MKVVKNFKLEKNDLKEVDRNIETSINNFFEKIRKSKIISDLSIEPLPLEQFTTNTLSILIKRTLQSESLYENYSIAQHVFEFNKNNFDISELVIYFPIYLRSMVEVGAYKDCLIFTNSILKSSLWKDIKNKNNGIEILRYRAKAFRNLGKFSNAEKTYRYALKLSEKLDNPIQVATTLILIGKLYGNYLGQQSLFVAFIEEAKSILELFLKEKFNNKSDHFLCMRQLAICYDSIGQAYRFIEPKVAIRNFNYAIHLNRKNGNIVGLSRNLCHLNYFLFFKNKGKGNPYKIKFLNRFQDGLIMVINNAKEKRGLGIRYIQYAEMLSGIGSEIKAKECFSEGKRIAASFSDFKTLTRASIVGAELFFIHDRLNSIKYLEDGQKLAKKYKLLLQESQINRKLAELFDSGYQSKKEPHQLFDRNRAIFLNLIKEVKANLGFISQQKGLKSESEIILINTQKNVREKLLLDYENIVNQLVLNITASSSALKINERRRQELLVLDICNSISRELLHELKLSIPTDQKISPLKLISENLRKEIIRLKSINNSILDHQSVVAHIDDIYLNIDELATRIESISDEMQKLKLLLTNRLKRPRKLSDTVSLAWACKKAVNELSQQIIYLEEIINFEFICDIELTCDKELIVTVIQNLIRNAVQNSNNLLKQKIILSIKSLNIGDLTTCNPSKSAIFSIMQKAESKKQAIIELNNLSKFFKEHVLNKQYSSGVGLDLAQTVFSDLLRADIRPSRQNDFIGLEIVFPIGSGHSKIVSKRIR
jgi:tetratricopeptide (TPR) repeat protein